MITHLLYDGSFEGFLTAVFEVYERKLDDVNIYPEETFQPGLYGIPLKIISDESKATRVWIGLKNKLSITKCNEIYKTFLSELCHREETILSFIRHVFSSKDNVEEDYGHKAMLLVVQIARQVHREKHRMEAFVRFQRTKEDTYFAVIEPDYNVLPLIASHFKDRYADQHWLIFDKKRDYGIQYDKGSGKVLEVHLDLNPEAGHEFLPEQLCFEDELAYQMLWQKYFKSVNIEARSNKKLHLRHMPTRYWKYLVEKNI